VIATAHSDLTHVKAGSNGFSQAFLHQAWRKPMPLDTVLVVIAVVMMFATFAVTMAWGDRQTGTRQPRRPF